MSHLSRVVRVLSSLTLAVATAPLAAQSRADAPTQLVITYRDGRRVNIPLSEIERFEVSGAAPVAAPTTAAATPSATVASTELSGLAAEIPGTWMHRSTAVFDIQRFLPTGVVTTRNGGRGKWSIDGTSLVVTWSNGVVHRYAMESGSTQLTGNATPADKKEKPEPITLERMRG
jgi:hypothetical protein